ncbi:MAG: mandelate racemase/muconate lactonizing enzyme family protein [Acidobacteria bacterium]|nr:mandelate racemase/muconate lactonizing enzyme family protein [Acidobacteriota bacterium]
MTRRELAGALLSAPMAAALPKMILTGLEIFRVKVNRRGNWILARLRTSAGLTGLGDASHGRDEQTVRHLHQFFELLRGRPLWEVERFRQAADAAMTAGGQPAVVAFSALEQCLWDLQAQAAGVPACALFGGKLRDGVRNYANINRSTDERTPDGFARMAERAVAAGFDAVKLAPFDDMPRQADAATAEKFTQLGIDCAAAVRRAIGPKRDLLIDAHSHFGLQKGLQLARRFEPLNLFWLEEVTPARPPENLAEINRAAKMPTAGGETIRGGKGFLPYIDAGAVDIVMPDIKYCGGMLELKKIAALAEAASLPVSPHGPASPIGNLAAAHVCLGLPNFLILEFSFGEVPWRAELVDPPEALENGILKVTDRPGLGMRLNEAVARRYAAD